jgi:hypothetical protein
MYPVSLQGEYGNVDGAKEEGFFCLQQNMKELCSSLTTVYS